MAYWLSCTTPKRFESDMANDFAIDGYEEEDFEAAIRVEPGDRIACYVLGWDAFAAICVARSRVFVDWRQIWPDAVCPLRFERHAEIALPRDRALPGAALLPQLGLAGVKAKHGQRAGHALRESLREIAREDFEVIERAMRRAAGEERNV